MGTGAKRKVSKEEEEERERKKKKNEKKLEVRAAKAKEQQEKQASWQKFAKKSERKGIHIAGVAGTSIFKTPENPLGRGAWSSRACVWRVADLVLFCGHCWSGSRRDGEREGHDGSGCPD